MAKLEIDLDGPEGSPHWLSKEARPAPKPRKRTPEEMQKLREQHPPPKRKPKNTVTHE